MNEEVRYIRRQCRDCGRTFWTFASARIDDLCDDCLLAATLDAVRYERYYALEVLDETEDDT